MTGAGHTPPGTGADLPPQLADQLAQLRDLRRRGEQVRQDLAATAATVRSRSGAVTLTVGAGGVLREVRLGDATRGMAPAALAAEIMSAYRLGARQAAERSAEIMSTLVGPCSPTLQLLRDAVPADPADNGQEESR